MSAVKIMGIINCTPDSFYAKSRVTIETYLERAKQLIDEGADWLDIGGESTRPGALPVSLSEESQRVLPVLEAIKASFDVPISVDTSKPELMAEALALGASMLNDVNAFQAEGALSLLEASLKPPSICLMHKQGEPKTMQNNPVYQDVVETVLTFFKERVQACEALGYQRENILLDPGIGFGKTLQDNLALLHRLSEFKSLGCRLLVGVSRKTLIGQIINKPPEGRLYGSLGLAAALASQGVDVIRTHDVGATKECLTLFESVNQGWWDESA